MRARSENATASRASRQAAVAMKQSVRRASKSTHRLCPAHRSHRLCPAHRSDPRHHPARLNWAPHQPRGAPLILRSAWGQAPAALPANRPHSLRSAPESRENAGAPPAKVSAKRHRLAHSRPPGSQPGASGRPPTAPPRSALAAPPPAPRPPADSGHVAASPAPRSDGFGLPQPHLHLHLAHTASSLTAPAAPARPAAPRRPTGSGHASARAARRPRCHGRCAHAAPHKPASAPRPARVPLRVSRSAWFSLEARRPCRASHLRLV